jgi:hypothetical protein
VSSVRVSGERRDENGLETGGSTVIRWTQVRDEPGMNALGRQRHAGATYVIVRTALFVGRLCLVRADFMIDSCRGDSGELRIQNTGYTATPAA